MIETIYNLSVTSIQRVWWTSWCRWTSHPANGWT